MGKSTALLWAGLVTACVALTGCQCENGCCLSGANKNSTTTQTANTYNSSTTNTTAMRPQTLPASNSTTTGAVATTTPTYNPSTLSAPTNVTPNTYNHTAPIMPASYQQDPLMAGANVPPASTMPAPAASPTYGTPSYPTAPSGYSNSGYPAPSGANAFSH